MGFMDKVMDTVKSADEKLGNAIDKEKLDSDIRKQERAIDDYTMEIGRKALAALKEGRDPTIAELADEFDKIKECEQKIAELKAEKESIGKS